MTFYPITPVPKPRMTQRDKWKKRPCVLRYRAFCDEVRLRINQDLDGASITFHIPMPSSWSTKKRVDMDGKPHRSRPDLDNFCKGIFDAMYAEDSHIAEITLRKVWAKQGGIEFT